MGPWTLRADRKLIQYLEQGEDLPFLGLFRRRSEAAKGERQLHWSLAELSGLDPAVESDPARQTAASPFRVLPLAGGGYRVCYPSEGEVEYTFDLSEDGGRLTAALPLSSGSAPPAALAFHLGLLFFYSVLRHGGIVLHAAVLAWRGRAVLISAAAGTGKSTHARLWTKTVPGAYILNGDKALCGASGSGFRVYGMPWCGTSGECLNDSLPVGAVVLLEQADENRAERLPVYEAAMGLMARSYMPLWDPAAIGAGLDLLDALTARVPVFRLRCRPDEGAVQALREALEPLFSEGEVL